MAKARENPDLAGLIGRPYGVRGFLSRVDRRLLPTAGGVRRDIATAALLLSRHLTWRPAIWRDHAAGSLAQVSLPFCTANRGHGEVSGTRPRAKLALRASSAWDRSRHALARAAGRAPICVWCRWPHQRQPQQPNLAAPLKHRRFATHQACGLPLEKNPEKRGKISVRALDRWAMICVRRFLRDQPRAQ